MDGNVVPFQSKAEPKPVVLIYSEEADTRFLFKTLLEMWNYQTAEAASVEEAIYVADRQRPNLVLMDIALPFIEYMMTLQQLQNIELFNGLSFVFCRVIRSRNIERRRSISGWKIFSSSR